MADTPESSRGPEGSDRGAAGSNGAAANGEADEIVRLRRRLAFYEGFDDLIQQNISRSGDLLRFAAQRQAEAERELAAEREDLTRAAAAQRDALDALAADLAILRRGMDALAARLETARAGCDRIVAQQHGSVAAPAAPAPASAQPAATMPGSQTPPQSVPASNQDRLATPAPAGSQDRDDRRSGSVIVHGIAGVEDARSYQTWLASRPGVQSVTPREFAAGILRLDVAAAPFPGTDAAGWPGHALEVVDLGPGATVLRLRGAAGL